MIKPRTEVLSELAHYFNEDLNKRFEGELMNIEFSIAHFLDPNSKGMCFVDEGEKFEVVKTAVKKAMEKLSKKEILASQNTPSPLMLDDEYDDNFDFTEQLKKKVFGAGYINLGGETSTKKAISAEIDGHLNSKPVLANTNVLEFWKQNQYIYPIMSRLARKNLCIPAASSTSERVFSTTGIYTAREEPIF